MRRISEIITEGSGSFTRGQRLLAAFVLEHTDKVAFMNSFDLAAVTGVSQSTVVRFATTLGYKGYGDLQAALREEIKYRLDILERFEVMSAASSDEETLVGIAATDSLNIKNMAGLNAAGDIRFLATHMHMAPRIYVYGQGYAFSAAQYLAAYLNVLLPSVCCVNQTGLDPLSAIAGISAGDVLVAISFPLHSGDTRRLAEYAREREAVVATITEGRESEIGKMADISLACEWGDFGVNGSMAPVISLCSAIVCILARNDQNAGQKLKNAGEAMYFKGSQQWT